MKILAILLLILGITKILLVLGVSKSSSYEISSPQLKNLIDSDTLDKILCSYFIIDGLSSIICGLFIFFVL